MKVTVEQVTPRKAAKWLETNTKNRPVRLTYVDTLADEITEGRWKENGDSIRFNGTELIDGQHRLMAIVKAGKPIKSIVVRDLPGHVFDTIDVGRSRKAADILALRGETSTATLAAVARLTYLYDSGTMQTKSRKTVTATRIEGMIQDQPGIREAVNTWRSRVNKSKLAPSGPIIACYHIASRLNRKQADDMMDKLVNGTALRDDPFHVLRERFIKMRLDKGSFNAEHYMALTLKCWNAARSGDPIGQLRYNDKGEQKEKFPVAK